MSGPRPVDLQSIVELSPDAIVVIDRRSRMVLVNANTERLFGWPRGQLLGRPLEMLMPERFRAEHLEAMSAERELSDSRSINELRGLCGLRADGSEFPIRVALARMQTIHGPMVIGTVRDVTEEQRHETRLQQMTERLSEAQRIAGMGSFEINAANDDVVWWSAEMWRVLGIDPLLEPSRGAVFSTVHPEDHAEVEALWTAFAPEDETLDFEHRVVHTDGRVRWVRTSARFDIRPDGGHAIIGTVTDITAMHVAFQQRTEAQRYFLLGFERSPIGMAVIDLDGRFSRVNTAYSRIVGRSVNELLHAPARGILPKSDQHQPSTTVAFPSWIGGESADTRTELLVPRPDGSAVWVDAVVSAVADEHAEPMFTFVQLQDITSRKHAESALEHRAWHDALTGLANRVYLTRHMTEVLERARERGTTAAVLFVDIDQFKLVNDSIGHAAGDALLVELADRLRGVIRGDDFLARFGGDELVIVCENMDVAAAESLAERILDMTRTPYELDGRELFVTLSIGVTLSDGTDEVATLLRSSDAAMYHAKEHGRARAAIYDETMHSLASARLDMESQLARALERGEFQVVYQPIVRVTTGVPTGFEALLRWNNPERGLVSPAEFMPVAEETGLIVPIGEWVLGQALAQLEQWHALADEYSQLRISVNVSAVQLRDAGFVPILEQTLAASSVDPGRINLELTETVAMGDPEKTAAEFEAIRSTGVRMAIDDFGTGYSSLSLLRELPVNRIKIDRSFVRPLGDDERASSLVRAIFALATAMDLEVVAEGVETDEQAEELRRLGIPLGQGFLWSRPQSPESITDWLKSRITD